MVTKPTYTNHHGFLMPFGFPSENFSSGLSYKPEKNDIFVCTYPKCGTTLMQHIVYLILNDGSPVQSNEKLDKLFPHLEEVGCTYVTDKASVKKGYRLIKTHLPYDMTPISPKAKYIFVARNPKDCVVSFFHHTRGFPKHYNFEDGDFDVYFELFIKGEVDFGDYFQCVKSFIEHRGEPNVLFLTYENLQNDKENTIRRVARFIDESIEETLFEDDGRLLKDVIHHSSIEEMKKHPLRWCSLRESRHTPFVRSGKVGGWNEILSEEQADRLNSMAKTVFTKEELQVLGEKYFS